MDLQCASTPHYNDSKTGVSLISVLYALTKNKDSTKQTKKQSNFWKCDYLLAIRMQNQLLQTCLVVGFAFILLRNKRR